MSAPKSEAGPAILSEDRRYRYRLTRVWDPEGKKLVFIGLNPSTADETQLDPTLRRCLRFGYEWDEGRFGCFAMLNLFAFRATDPKEMKLAYFPVGPENDRYLVETALMADMVVACWGVHGAFRGRDVIVRNLLAECGVPLYHLGLTRDGHPRHPLYLSANTTPTEWTR